MLLAGVGVGCCCVFILSRVCACLKHVADSHLVTGADDSTKLEYKFRKVKMKLKNRIGPSTLNPENTLDFME